MSAGGLTGPHWTFALELYGRPGVADACLKLQDRAGVDVNVLLIALYAVRERGLALSSRQVAALDAVASEWRASVVERLRSIRRDLKHGPRPAPNADAESLRDVVKKAELRAEQIEQAELAAWVDSQPSDEDAGPRNPAGVIEAVVAFYGGDARRTELAEAVETIATALSRT